MDKIEVTVQSILPTDEPQGRFRLRVDPNDTVELLLRNLCIEANAPFKLEYCLRSKGHDLLNRTDTLAKSGVQDGAFLHWTSEGVQTEAGCRCNTFWFLALVSFVIGTVGIIAICVIRFKDEQPVTDYAVVFDAGSTHTAMFIYKWEGSKLNGTAVASQFGNSCTGDGHGIANFAANPAMAGKSLEACLQKAQKAVPSHKHSETPVYLGATAGMRLLNETDSKASDAILDSVRATFKKSKFSFSNPTRMVRIITGADEGTFSWISSNYITNSFRLRKRNGASQAMTIVPNLGALDLGGASTQITFIPRNGSVVPQGYSSTVQLFGKNYTVYTHSYLCYGVKEVQGRIFAHLWKNRKDNSTEIPNACLPSHFNVTLSYDEIFASPCVSGQAGREAFGSVILPEAYQDKDTNYTFMGESLPSACDQLVSAALFNFTAPCPYSRCSFNGVYQPELNGLFYGFSTFYYVSEFLNMTTKNQSYYSLPELEAAVDKLCQMPWEQVQKLPTSRKENLPYYCLQSEYIHTLLTKGYGFSNSTWENINFVDQVASNDIGWTLGFVLGESVKYPANYPEVTMYTLTFALLVVLFCLFLLVSVGLAVQGRRAQRSQEVRYRRMSSYGAI